MALIKLLYDFLINRRFATHWFGKHMFNASFTVNVQVGLEGHWFTVCGPGAENALKNLRLNGTVF